MTKFFCCPVLPAPCPYRGARRVEDMDMAAEPDGAAAASVPSELSPELGQELGPPEPDPFDVFGPAASLSADDEPQQQEAAEGEVRESSPQADAGEEGEGEDNELSHEDQLAHLREMLLMRGYRPKLDADGIPRSAVLSSFDIDGIAEYLERNDCRNVVVMAGAGISVSAGIPDFRSPGTGCAKPLSCALLGPSLPSPDPTCTPRAGCTTTCRSTTCPRRSLCLTSTSSARGPRPSTYWHASCGPTTTTPRPCTTSSGCCTTRACCSAASRRTLTRSRLQPGCPGRRSSPRTATLTARTASTLGRPCP